jgi:GNAT superfamily N-acetyltransferase
LELEIRAASRADGPAISRLLGQLGYEATFEFVERVLSRRSQDGLDGVFVALVRGEVAGVVSLHAHELSHVPGRLGRITALVVDEGTRGTGVGRALVERAEAFFRDAGCIRMEVTSGLRREEAHGFYRAQGFGEIARHFVKPL